MIGIRGQPRIETNHVIGSSAHHDSCIEKITQGLEVFHSLGTKYVFDHRTVQIQPGRLNIERNTELFRALYGRRVGEIAVSDSEAFSRDRLYAIGRLIGIQQQVRSAAARGTSSILPVIEEQLIVGKRSVPTGGVRIDKTATTHDEIVDLPVTREEVRIEHVPINRLVSSPVASRQEGDTLIIPVLEEVPVVGTQLVLKEEVRITKVCTTKRSVIGCRCGESRSTSSRTRPNQARGRSQLRNSSQVRRSEHAAHQGGKHVQNSHRCV